MELSNRKMNSHYASNVPLLCTLAALLLNDFNIDAQQFTGSSQDETKFGNKSQSVDFIWTYDTPDFALTTITCGITGNPVVFKPRGGAAAVQNNFNGKADAIDLTTNRPYTIGFILKNAEFSDANVYGCSLQYNTIAPKYSKNYIFGIYETPTFVSCLSDGLLTDATGASYFAVREDEALNSTCYVYGNPVPSLDCRLYDASNIQQQALPIRNLNFTSLLNERMVFRIVKRQVKKVICIADGGATGRWPIEREVRVDYLPSAPRFITLMESTLQSIRITWTAPLEPGLSVITDYYMELVHPNGTITYRNHSVTSVNAVLDYTFNYLYGSQTYGIYIAAYNAVGKGATSTLANFQTVNYKRDSSPRSVGDLSDGAIFLLIVALPGGLMLLIIIAINVRKKMKEEPEYPDAYVEETVDYEPPEGGMYALVDKKKSKPDANEQNSNFPFTIHQVNKAFDDEKPMLQKDSQPTESPRTTTDEKSRKEDF